MDKTGSLVHVTDLANFLRHAFERGCDAAMGAHLLACLQRSRDVLEGPVQLFILTGSRSSRQQLLPGFSSGARRSRGQCKLGWVDQCLRRLHTPFKLRSASRGIRSMIGWAPTPLVAVNPPIHPPQLCDQIQSHKRLILHRCLPSPIYAGPTHTHIVVG